MQRISWVFDGKFELLKSLISHAKQSLKDFTTAQIRYQAPRVRNLAARMDASRRKSKGEVFKANWDAIIVMKTNKMGIRVIVKNSDGDIMACLCSTERLFTKYGVVEALA